MICLLSSSVYIFALFSRLFGECLLLLGIDLTEKLIVPSTYPKCVRILAAQFRDVFHANFGVPKLSAVQSKAGS